MATATAIRRGEAEHPEPMELTGPSGDLRRLKADAARWSRFHTNRRILIVDDCEPTCLSLKSQLTMMYPAGEGNVVEYETDPARAKERILAAAKERRYDAVVMDLLMPTQGHVLLKEINRENPEALGGVVINTASTADSLIGDMMGQWDTYRSERDVEAIGRGGSPLPTPIVVHDKVDGTPGELSAKLDNAMNFRDRGWGDMGGFLEAFKPHLLVNYPAEIAHEIVEEARNASRALIPIVREMRLRHSSALERNNWWRVFASNTDEALAAFSKARFSEVYVPNDPKKTGDNLHEIVNKFFLMTAPKDEDLQDIRGNRELMGLVSRYRASVSPFARMSDLWRNFKDYEESRLDVAKILGDAAGANLRVEEGTKPEDLTLLGKSRLKDLLTKPVEAAKARVASNPGSSFDVSVSLVDDVEGLHSTENLKGRLRHLGRRFIRVAVSDNAPSPGSFQDAYGAFIFDLPRAEADGLAAYYPEKPAGGGLRFTLYLKLDDGGAAAPPGHEPQPPAKERPAKATRTMRLAGDDVQVHEGLGRAGDIVVIGDLPDAEEWGRHDAGQYYEHSGRRIIAAKDIHMSTSILLMEYVGEGRDPDEMQARARLGGGDDAAEIQKLFNELGLGRKVEGVSRQGDKWTIKTDKGDESISLWGAPGRRHAQLSFDPEMICRLREEEGGRFEVRANLWNVVHRDSVRLMVRRYGGGVIIDSGPEDEKGRRARDALVELGVPADKIDFKPDRFMPKEYA